MGERSAPAFPLTLSFANNTTDVGRVFILWFFMFLLKYKNMFLCFYVFNPKSVFFTTMPNKHSQAFSDSPC